MTTPLHIVQIAPEIGPGSGVGMVAYALEREFQLAGARVERFTLADARGKPTPPSRSRFRLAWDVVWFSTIGTVRAKAFLAQRPDAVSICHNDVLAGDVYVNHGILAAAMKARGHHVLRMLRNPLHVFTALRDRIRYRGRTHKAIVALSSSEAQLLREVYGRVRAPITVIGNGVDLERFRPATVEERSAARTALGVADDNFVLLFIGNEFDRKGLPILLDALPLVESNVHLLVVGGSDEMISAARARAARGGVSSRVHFVGPQNDVRSAMYAADVFGLLSAYEASALVLLEALASGLPVIATSVGVAGDVVHDGVNGYIVPRNVLSLLARIESFTSGLSHEWRNNARRSAQAYSWKSIGQQYLDLLETVRRYRDAAS